MLDGTAISMIADLARQKDAPAVLHPGAEPPHVYLRRNAEGDYSYTIADPHPRNHTASDLSAIAGKCAEAVENCKTTARATPPEIWFSRAGVTLFTDADTRRDRVVLPLSFSPQLARLQQWEQSRTPISQQELILTMRTIFRGATQGIDLGELVRRIRTTVSTASDQQRTRASLGKSIEAAVGDQNSLPDYVAFWVPVFSAGALAAIAGEVLVAFDFEGESQRFYLQPVAGEIETAITVAESSLGTILAARMADHGADSDSYGLYYGKP